MSIRNHHQNKPWTPATHNIWEYEYLLHTCRLTLVLNCKQYKIFTGTTFNLQNHGYVSMAKGHCVILITCILIATQDSLKEYFKKAIYQYFVKINFFCFHFAETVTGLNKQKVVSFFTIGIQQNSNPALSTRVGFLPSGTVEETGQNWFFFHFLPGETGRN